MQTTLKNFIKNTLIYGVATILPKAVNVILVGLHTLTFPRSEYNEVSEFFTWAAYFNVILTFGMETAFFKFYNSEKDKLKVLNTAFISVSLVCIFIIGFFLIFADFFAFQLSFRNTNYFRMLLGILFFDTMVVVPFAYLRVTNQSLKYTGYKTLFTVIYATLNLIFLGFLPKSLTIENILIPNIGGVFTANVIANGILFCTVLPVFKKFRFHFDVVLFKKMFSYGWPILVAGLAYATNENLDKLIIPKLLNEDIGGMYAGAYKLGIFMALFTMAFKLGAEPFFFNYANNKNAKVAYALILKWFGIAGSIICLVVVAYIDFFASFLLKQPEYLKALNIVPIILIANLFLGLYNNLSIWYKLTNKTKYGMYLSSIGAVLTIIGLFVFIPKVGYIGAAWATLITYGTICIISYVLGQKEYPIKYDLPRVIGSLAITSILCYLSFVIFRGNILINTGLILLFLTYIYLSEYKFIHQLISKKKS